ncbi:MAG TPA: GNAT family N-acetyltransferase [Ferruginibacter sp.]|nr:GNAT family N-acetyltransferase [Ferruginibacter sp.]
MAISYVTYQDINKKKWDDCIDRAGNGVLYAYSFYLDTMSKNWDALVLNDYETVMPLTWNKKYSIYYLYQPSFTACLGIFGNQLSSETINEFLKAVPAKFKYWDIYLNPGNFFKLTDFTLYERMNYVLSLNGSYEHIYSRYRDNIKRNIKKAEQLGLLINKNISVAGVISMAKEQAQHFADIPAADYKQFETLYSLLYQKEKATTYGVYTKEGQLLASAVFFFSHGRAYYILVGNHPNGKTLGASHALINAFIKDHAGQNIKLDFEGSDISSLAFFYSSFGAVEEKYSAIRLNRLPGPLKWFKK